MLKPTSFLNYFNTIITCKSLSFCSENFSVAKDLNLSPLVKQPALANRYNTLVNSCLKANNLDAHFLKGMLEYFQSQNQFLGLHHIRIASKSGHLQGRYVYGVLLSGGATTCGGRLPGTFSPLSGTPPSSHEGYLCEFSSEDVARSKLPSSRGSGQHSLLQLFPLLFAD
ncbi:hypothetical protein Bca101_000544 [Brassica carinata]